MESFGQAMEAVELEGLIEAAYSQEHEAIHYPSVVDAVFDAAALVHIADL